MCYTCEMLLRDEHRKDSLRFAKKYPCPKCKVFAASGDIPPQRGRKAKPKLCYHYWSKKSLGPEDSTCPLCLKAAVQ